MSRKDYQRIADAIASVHQKIDGQNEMATEAVHMVQVAIADQLAEDNPRFSRYRFNEACYAR